MLSEDYSSGVIIQGRFYAERGKHMRLVYRRAHSCSIRQSTVRNLAKSKAGHVPVIKHDTT